MAKVNEDDTDIADRIKTFPWKSDRIIAIYREEIEARYEGAVDALILLLCRDEMITCKHEETHRGGYLWEICDGCKAKWSDDLGGRPKWADPAEWTRAREALAKIGRG